MAKVDSIKIAHAAKLKPITRIARKLGIKAKDLTLYGNHKAKVDHRVLKRLSKRRDGKLVLVTGITPTKFGEGKTVNTVGLGQGLARLGKKAMICLREPSMGPVFGIKGGAAGGGYSQVAPMEDINLMFTGDIPAVGAANNLLAAMIDNHLSQGNTLNLDPKTLNWKRCLDVNDRALRDIVVCDGTHACIEHEGHFVITAASEVMAILCLSRDLMDLKKRLGNIVVGYTHAGKAVRARQLKAAGAMTAILRDALNPNLVQSLEGVPAFVHGGPFANIAHGTNSVMADKIALKLADFVVTESGFGSDLGFEKFMDIVSRQSGLAPDAAVVVATVRALKRHGNGSLDKGFANLARHIENVQRFGVPLVVAVNHFEGDAVTDLAFVVEKCSSLGVEAVVSEAFARGGNGAKPLAQAVLRALKKKAVPRHAYALRDFLEEKIEGVARRVYGAARVNYSAAAKKDLRRMKANGFDKLPICISKTQYSFSHDPRLFGAPRDYVFEVRNLEVSAGAGFVVVYAGSLIAMPGLPKKPAAERVDVKSDGTITGLF